MPTIINLPSGGSKKKIFLYCAATRNFTGTRILTTHVGTKLTWGGSSISYNADGIKMVAPVNTNCQLQTTEFTFLKPCKFFIKANNKFNRWVNLKIFKNGVQQPSNIIQQGPYEKFFDLEANVTYKFELQCDSELLVEEISIVY